MKSKETILLEIAAIQQRQIRLKSRFETLSEEIQSAEVTNTIQTIRFFGIEAKLDQIRKDLLK